MMTLSGPQPPPGGRAYALEIPGEPGETEASVMFGWMHDPARLVYQWKLHPVTRPEPEEIAAMVAALRDPQIDAWGYRLVEGHRHVIPEAAWLLDLDDVQPYYDGPPTADAHAIRGWVAANVRDKGIARAMLDGMLEFDGRLTPALVAQLPRQIDE